MKKLVIVIVLAAFCCFGSYSMQTVIADNAASNPEIFTQEQLESLYGAAGTSIRQIVMLGDTLYAYTSNASVLSWRIGDPTPRIFCQLPDLPEATATVYAALDSETRHTWDEAVNSIAAGDDALWGINIFRGRVGSITAEGIQWSAIQLDMSSLVADDYSWPLRIVSTFVTNHILYAYVALDDGDYPQNNYKLLAFDLDSGACKALDIQNAQGICLYKSEAILLLCLTAEDTWTIRVMDLASGEISASPFQSFASSSDKPIGGLAYDQSSGRLFFTNKSQVWGAAENKAYEALATVPIPDILGEATAFALADGTYAVLSGCLYVREADASSATAATLTVQGCMDQTIYESFIDENPDVSVDFSSSILSSDDIVQALITGSQTADLYATFADQTFRSLVEKGYAADLSTSAILSSDIQSMYPHIQNVITNPDGKPVAYPYQLLLGHWQVNEELWRLIFGDTVPLPATYDQFMDAMVLWESTYANEYPEISFAGNFDHAYWIRKIINAYAQQYGQSDSPLDMQTTVLYGVLKKLEQVCQIRRSNGQNTAFLPEGTYISKTDIFITAGYNNVLLDPAETQPQEDVELADIIDDPLYTDMPALVFAQGEESQIPGQMLVWFVNPYSQHKELAIRYLENAAQMDNNTRTYYATHPDCNDPVLYAGYRQTVQDLEAYRAALQEALQEADRMDASALQDDIRALESRLANQDKHRWLISASAIESYRKIAPSISFFEDNRYITPDGSILLEQLESLYQRYVDNSIDLDSFLSELDHKMRMLYLEGE